MTNVKSGAGIVSTLNQGQRCYAKEWGGGNARKISVESYCFWMAGFLEGHDTELDIGSRWKHFGKHLGLFITTLDTEV